LNRGIAFLLLVIGLGAISGFLFTQRDFNYGLDVRGGIRLTYSMDTADKSLTPEQRSNLGLLRENLVKILQNRATGALGVAEPNVSSKGDNRFIIELPGATDEANARQTMSSTASILWYHAKTVATSKPAGQFRTYMPSGEAKMVDGKPEVQFVKRSDSSATPIAPVTEDGRPNPAYKAIIESWGEPILKGDDLLQASIERRGEGYIPAMRFSEAGARKMDRWSRLVFNQGENIAAVLDGVVVSIAPIKDGTILSDNAIIDGTFDTGYVRNLVGLLNSGSIPVTLKLESSERVDPTIGKAALDKIVFAGAIAFGFIGLFLIAYYSFPGFVALLALLLYVLFTLTVLKWINATFSLAAIAGFILSVGMAVDANILVFERLKEEMKSGKTLKQGIELGFGRALPAIIDSNACTILTSFVLAGFGTGPVKGFATTLIIGVAISLFTAITITRSLLIFFVNTGVGSNPKWYALERNWFGEKFEAEAETNPIKIVQRSKLWLLISLATIIPGALFIGMGGLKPNVEFQGGFEAQYQLTADKSSLTTPQILESLEKAGFKGGNVKLGTGKDDAKIVYITLPTSKQLTDAGDGASKVIADAANLGNATSSGFTQVSPTIQRETVQNAILGVLLSSALIVVYLAFRFGIALGSLSLGLRFGMSAILALLHDVLVVLGISAIVGYFLGWEVSALFITSMLTVIGFSVHDTIVIFDRIRENLRKPIRGEDFGHLINRSVSQSFARSINTSMTVIVTLIILLLFGTATPDLKLFCVTMLAGIVSGTYSSIFNASPILWLWDTAIQKKKGEAATILGVATQHATQATIIPGARIEDGSGEANVDGQGRSYGQVKRRRASDQGKIRLDD